MTDTNKYSFEMHNRSITLAPLSPQQAYADQLKLQREEEQRRVSERKKESSEQKREIGEKKKEGERKRKERENLKESEKKQKEK